jgi:hypothetical protein
VQSLGLSDRGDTLSHWIAHYLAELFAAEDAASGEAKVRLGAKITQTSLLLWKSREHLPRHADPTERYAKAAEALRAIHLGMAARSKWDQFLPGNPMPPTLRFYEKSSRLAMLGVLELVRKTSEDFPDWLAQLVTSEEENFVAVIGEAYARLTAEHADSRPLGALKQEKLREMRKKLLDELQELLNEMRTTS